MKITLYDYQEVAYHKVIKALRKFGCALMVMATGLGKTIVSSKIIEFFILSQPKTIRVLFLCHDTGILEQCYKKYRAILGEDYTYTRFFGKYKSRNAYKYNFVFATFQSKPHRFFKHSHFDYVIVDESHHAKADTYNEVMEFFTPKWKLGMTATPDREDEKDIRHMFGKEVVNYPLPEAIANGWVTPIDYRILSDGLDQEVLDALVRDVLVENLRITENQMNERLFVRARTEVQCKKILEHTKNGLKAIVFCNNIEHLEHVAEILPRSVIVHSGKSAFENNFAKSQYEAGYVSHILVVDKFNEGIDLPDTDVLAFLRATDSYRIWLQQLGRGLRKLPGKHKIIVLDFVANIERIKNVRNFVWEIEKHKGSYQFNSEDLKLKDTLHIEGDGFMFDFSEEIVNVLSVLEHVVDVDFYKTWQEASQASIKLGLKNRKEYQKLYKQDPKLPSNPHNYYKGFPGYFVFLAQSVIEFYPTWQEARKVAIRLGIREAASKNGGLSKAYNKMYKKDPRLPSTPHHVYSDFPGFEVFLGKTRNFYPTWEKAGKAAIRVGIFRSKEYSKLYKKDPKLPPLPNKYYSDFPGFVVFLGNTSGIGAKKYTNWQEASKAAIKLKISGSLEYQNKYKKDPMLPGSPESKYSDFPGWAKFLGTKRGKGVEKYETWQEAAKSTKKLGINTQLEYRKKFMKDSKLPSNPNSFYLDFPGFAQFFGRPGRSDKYKTWEQAARAVKKLGIKNSDDYRKKYGKDPKLPGNIFEFYPDFPGFTVFLGGQVIEFYKTWRIAAKILKKNGIENWKQYFKLRKKDPRLPSSPSYVYSDFPGGDRFFSKR